MIVDFERRFAFVHPWKTGGTSVARALGGERRGPQTPWQRALAFVERAGGRVIGRPVLGKHAAAVDIRARIGAARFDGLYSFGFVRNPWDWLVSWHTFVRETRVSPDTGRAWTHHLRAELAHLDFPQFVRWVERGGLTRAGGRRRSSFSREPKVLQLDWFSDHDGQLLVDFVGRFEALADDFATACAAIGLEGYRLPHVNKSEHRTYQSYYTPETRDAVGAHFERDIQTFGYRF